jgi:hypothetical protein
MAIMRTNHWTDLAHGLLSRADLHRVGDELILRYAPVSIAAYCALFAVALALAGLCWLVAREFKVRQSPRGVAELRIAAIGLAVFGLGSAVIILPGVVQSEVRISRTRLSQTGGLWFKPRLREFPLAQIRLISRTSEAGEFESRAVWTLFGWDGRLERFEPGDLIARNPEPVIAELRARGVLVLSLKH